MAWEEPYNIYRVLEILADSDPDRMTVTELDMPIQQVSRRGK